MATAKKYVLNALQFVLPNFFALPGFVIKKTVFLAKMIIKV